MSQKDLFPLKPKGDPYSDAIRKKLKGSGSEKRKVAQRIRRIKEMSSEDIEDKALRIVQDEQFSAIEIEKLIIEMLKRPISENLRARLIDTGIRAHQAIHGNKSRNLNVNVETTTIWDRVKSKIKDEQSSKSKDTK